jgi:hypothetical protein
MQTNNYRDGQFYWWRKHEYAEKATDQSQSHWQTLSHNVVSSTSCHECKRKKQLMQTNNSNFKEAQVLDG